MSWTPLLTVEEAADCLRVSIYTVRRYIRDRKLPAVMLGSAYRVKQENLKEFLEAHAT